MMVGFLVVAGASGCSAAFHAAREGQEALERGDVEAAARHYHSACRQSDDQDWCQRADRLYLDLKATLLVEAKPVCGQRGFEKKCFDLVNRARRVRDDPQLAALAGLSGTTWLEACRQLPVTTPVDALVRARCVETMRSEVSTAAYGQQVAAERRSLAQFVATQATLATERQLVANALGLATLARCLSDEGTPPVEPARRQVSSSLVVRAHLEAHGLALASDVCAQLQQASRNRLECISEGHALALRVGLTRSEVTHDITDTVHDVTYVARREVYENPEWHRLENLRQRREREARGARKKAALAKDACDLADHELFRANLCTGCDARRAQEAACQRARTLDSFRTSADSELDDATSKVNRTERQLVNEITDVYRYTERTHTWRQNFRVVIASSNPSLASRDLTLEAARTGTDRPGLRASGHRRPRGEAAESG
jgi:hypothetical protein